MAKLAGIDENLIRNELSVLDRSISLRRRKEIYEGLHPEARRPEGGRPQKNSEIISSFTTDTAAKTGAAVRSIQQEVQIGTYISGTIQEQIVDMPVADSKVELLELARLEPQEQQQVVDQLKSGTAQGYWGDREAFLFAARFRSARSWAIFFARGLQGSQ